MEYRRLGNSDLEVSVITLGCWEFGNTPGFATADQAEVDAVVHAALEAGVNLFDTAQVYSDGRSEELLGRALRGRREKALIATKFLDFRTWTRDEILDRLKASLGRLDTDYVDLYQMHWPLAQMTPRAVEVMAQAFEEILRTGLARAVGVSNFRLEHLSLLSEATADRLASNQIPLNLLWRVYEIEGACEFCRRHALGLLAYSPLAQGLLAGRYRREERPTAGPLAESKWAREEIYGQTMNVVEELKAVAAEVGRSPAQVALNWLLARPGVSSVIVGTTRPTHLLDDLGALGWRLDDALEARLDRASLAYQKHLDPKWASIWGAG